MKSNNSELFWLSGASSGIGYAVAEELAKKKASIIISSRNANKISDKIGILKNLGASSIELVDLDISEDEAKNTINNTLKGRKLAGVLVNGGAYTGKKLVEYKYEDFLQSNKNILAGPAQFILNILPFCEHNNSSIVAITSTSVKEPVGLLHMSAIYRSGLVVFLKNLAHEIGHTGIRINNVGPGSTATEHIEHLIESSAITTNTNAEIIRKNFESRSALNRMADPSEIAKVVTFLFSKDASFINGQTILVDGCSTRSYL
ncbi:SDR family oxidoreductase [Pigmentibacter sp. JX0631]|uniref:SDR family oxidoreductase n=1 Tax=Pigmentibacter sp. JX0631 TaxID=2976982 RepID=UPI002468595C|nr:SDR family oxidoreductase [Pigmentibacter sp. JX0631]WGL61136.1 SDR family oxidoreductase [Pigmentibacter sp. JX0631]